MREESEFQNTAQRQIMEIWWLCSFYRPSQLIISNVFKKQSDFKKSSSYFEEHSIGCLEIWNIPFFICIILCCGLLPQRNQWQSIREDMYDRSLHEKSCHKSSWLPGTPGMHVKEVLSSRTPWFSHDSNSLSGESIGNLPVSISLCICLNGSMSSYEEIRL